MLELVIFAWKIRQIVMGIFFITKQQFLRFRGKKAKKVVKLLWGGKFFIVTRSYFSKENIKKFGANMAKIEDEASLGSKQQKQIKELAVSQ